MSEWSRPGPDDPAEAPRFEVPLAGADDEGELQSSGRARTRWRRVVAVSGVAGIVLGIVVGVVIATDDDGDDESTVTTTTLDPDEQSSSITVPPTLTPVDPDGSDASETGRGVDPLPTIADADPATFGAYDLDAALAALDENAPRQAHTRYVAGADGFVLDVNVLHDSLNDRYRIELEYAPPGGARRQVIVLDTRGDTAYVRVDSDGEEGDWLRVPNAQILAQTGSDDVGALGRSLLLGPVRSDTGVSALAADGLASLDGTPVREFSVGVAVGAARGWAPYVFAPPAEVPPPPVTDLLTFTVHVDGDARLRRVSGVSAYGNTEQTVVHTIERLPRLEVIDLPTSFAILDEDGQVVTDSEDLVPEYGVVVGDPPTSGYDLETALDALTESPPLRATVELLGDANTVAIAERDPDTGVVAAAPGTGDTPPMLVDTTSGRTLLLNEDGSYAEDTLIEGDAFVETLLQGVIEPSALIDADPVGFFRREDRMVQRFDATLSPPALRYLGLGAGREVPVRVYVDESSRVVELHVLSTGGVPAALVQRFEHDGEAPTVTLPADSG